jgi:hypothetical protein
MSDSRASGCIAAPDHLNSAYPDRYPNSTETLDQELQHLKDKVDAGADYIVTQLFYDVDGFLSWQARVRAAGICLASTLFVLVLNHLRHNCAHHSRSDAHPKLCLISAGQRPDRAESAPFATPSPAREMCAQSRASAL